MESGLKNENLLLKIERSGSFTLPLRNSAGVNFFDDRDFEDGVISRPLRRDGYDLELLRQSIDISITELADVTDVELPDTVLREVYNDALAQIEEITETVQRLERENSELETTVSNLEAEISNLKSLNDNLEILKAISDNQLEVINDRLITVIEDLQSAIQKSIAEAIQRVSLQSRNELLISENNSLKEQLFGRQAQIEAGAKSSGTLFTVRSPIIGNTSETPIYATQRFKRFGFGVNNRDITIVNGSTIEIFNASTEALTIQITRNGQAKRWINPISNVTVNPSEKSTIQISTKKEFSENRNAKSYTGALLFSTTSNGITEQVTLGANIKRIKI
jgi:DNA-binding transcriptional MerR regulator